MRPSHWIFQTPLGHCCPGRLLPVYTSLSTSSKTYCISASCFSLSLSLPLCHFTLLFLSLTSSLAFFAHHCPLSFSARDSQSLPIYFVAVVSPLCPPISALYFPFYCFSAHFLFNGAAVSPLAAFIVFSRFFLSEKKQKLFCVPS